MVPDPPAGPAGSNQGAKRVGLSAPTQREPPGGQKLKGRHQSAYFQHNQHRDVPLEHPHRACQPCREPAYLQQPDQKVSAQECAQ